MGGAAATDKNEKGVVPEGGVTMDELNKKEQKNLVTAATVDAKFDESKIMLEKSPVSPKYKEYLRKKVSDLKDDSVSDLEGIKVDKSAKALDKLDKNLASIHEEVSGFESRTEVKTLLKFADNKNALAKQINITTINPDDVDGLTEHVLHAIKVDGKGGNIDSQSLKDLQATFGLPETGKVDVETLKKIGDVIGVSINPQIGKETVYTDGSKYESPDAMRERDVKIVQEKVVAMSRAQTDLSMKSPVQYKEVSGLINTYLDKLVNVRDRVMAGMLPRDNDEIALILPVENAKNWAKGVIKEFMSRGNDQRLIAKA